MKYKMIKMVRLYLTTQLIAMKSQPGEVCELAQTCRDLTCNINLATNRATLPRQLIIYQRIDNITIRVMSTLQQSE